MYLGDVHTSHLMSACRLIFDDSWSILKTAIQESLAPGPREQVRMSGCSPFVAAVTSSGCCIAQHQPVVIIAHCSARHSRLSLQTTLSADLCTRCILGQWRLGCWIAF